MVVFIEAGIGDAGIRSGLILGTMDLHNVAQSVLDLC